ncbi:WD40 repeat-like protein [Dendrothele bispora CBS 962.96]|uniref:WD40 repeat-like protein n=1 Tax=Dendrothele bispora (strain CBS 962.96) TaxID=1314807 RepID=A0A4S8MZ12_DENBC|nr:WD40 repeat-like protein [Dendrothele bispora CBS 962.96]
MRVQHTAHAFPAFPVYSSSFVSENQLILGGGGGASKSGIKNKLRLYTVRDDRSVELNDEFELEKGEDAPMSMAAHPDGKAFVCGVNSAIEVLQKGVNENCRSFSIENGKLSLTRTQGTIVVSDDKDDFQKVTVVSPDGKLIAVAGSNTLHVLSYPSLAPIGDPIKTEQEIYDAAFSKSQLVIATTANLQVYNIPETAAPKPSPSKSKKKGKQKSTSNPTLVLDRTVEIPASLGGSVGNTFRAAKFHAKDDSVFYTVMNTIPKRTRSKSSPKQAFVCKWNTESWTIEKTRKVGDRSITCFAVSPDGKFLGYGSSDLSVGLLDAVTLNPAASILKAHEFSVTTIVFNPSSKLLVSGGADHSIRVVTIPEVTGSIDWSLMMFILLAIVVLLIAFAVQRQIA